MSASRTDLLAWLNELLQINYTKVEQCGSGGAYCQILDSIYGEQHVAFYDTGCSKFLTPCHISGDIPMTRVKMNAKHEYEYIANFKVMQNVFKSKKIDKVRSSTSFKTARLPVINFVQANPYREAGKM